MRIGLDFDGVIVDTIPAMMRYARELYGVELSPSDCIVPSDRLGSEEFGRLVAETHASAYGLTFEPTPGALIALDELANHHELIVVTARVEESFANAVRWIELNGLAGCFSAVRSSLGPRKSELADALGLDCFVDDVPRTFGAWSALATPLLWDAEYNRDHLVVLPGRRVVGWRGLSQFVRPS